MSDNQKIYIVDDDADIRDSTRVLLESAGLIVQCYASATLFLADKILKGGCLIADIRMPDMGGLELQEELVRSGVELPVIIVTGHGDVPLAVQAMRAGAIDFIEKPFNHERLLDSVQRGLRVGQKLRVRSSEINAARELLKSLTPREIGVLECLVKGRSNKVAAYELGISPRTVEIHRARIMGKMKVRSLSDLVRIVLTADHSLESEG